MDVRSLAAVPVLVLVLGVAGAHAADGDAATAPATPATPAEPATAPLAPLAPREASLHALLAEGRLSGDHAVLEDATGASFLVREQPARSPPASGALLVVPGPDTLISADPLLAALAEELPPNGWTVLAVQAPPVGDDAAAMLRARLDAALARLREAGSGRVAALGLEAGAAALREALDAGFGDGAIVAFAARGAWPGALPAGDMPVLELLPTADTRALAHAASRERTAASDARSYRPQRYDGLGRDFAGAAAAVARDLRGWLTRLPAP